MKASQILFVTASFGFGAAKPFQLHPSLSPPSARSATSPTSLSADVAAGAALNATLTGTLIPSLLRPDYWTDSKYRESIDCFLNELQDEQRHKLKALGLLEKVAKIKARDPERYAIFKAEIEKEKSELKNEIGEQCYLFGKCTIKEVTKYALTLSDGIEKQICIVAQDNTDLFKHCKSLPKIDVQGGADFKQRRQAPTDAWDGKISPDRVTSGVQHHIDYLEDLLVQLECPPSMLARDFIRCVVKQQRLLREMFPEYIEWDGTNSATTVTPNCPATAAVASSSPEPTSISYLPSSAVSTTASTTTPVVQRSTAFVTSTTTIPTLSSTTYVFVRTSNSASITDTVTVLAPTVCPTCTPLTIIELITVSPTAPGSPFQTLDCVLPILPNGPQAEGPGSEQIVQCYAAAPIALGSSVPVQNTPSSPATVSLSTASTSPTSISSTPSQAIPSLRNTTPELDLDKRTLTLHRWMLYCASHPQDTRCQVPHGRHMTLHGWMQYCGEHPEDVACRMPKQSEVEDFERRAEKVLSPRDQRDRHCKQDQTVPGCLIGHRLPLRVPDTESSDPVAKREPEPSPDFHDLCLDQRRRRYPHPEPAARKKLDCRKACLSPSTAQLEKSQRSEKERPILHAAAAAETVEVETYPRILAPRIDRPCSILQNYTACMYLCMTGVVDVPYVNTVGRRRACKRYCKFDARACNGHERCLQQPSLQDQSPEAAPETARNDLAMSEDLLEPSRISKGRDAVCQACIDACDDAIPLGFVIYLKCRADCHCYEPTVSQAKEKRCGTTSPGQPAPRIINPGSSAWQPGHQMPTGPFADFERVRLRGAGKVEVKTLVDDNGNVANREDLEKPRVTFEQQVSAFDGKQGDYPN